MRMVCTSEDICGWAGEIAVGADWICPYCHSLILPEVEDEGLRVPWQTQLEQEVQTAANTRKTISPAWNSDAED